MVALQLSLILLSLLVQDGLCISFQLEPDSRKCIREEVHKDVLVVGEYDIEVVPSQKTSIEVSGALSLWLSVLP